MPPVSHLSPETADPDPLVQFRNWYDEAVTAGVRQPDAMTLATAGPDGSVSARTVLMRGTSGGFAFYTNLESVKAIALEANARAALVWHWRELERQVRAVGAVERVPDDVAAAYWASRPRGHRISAWASPQSEVIDGDELGARVAAVEQQFSDSEPPLPKFWGGYLVVPAEVEFWQGRADRLHDRVRYRRVADAWRRERLAP